MKKIMAVVLCLVLAGCIDYSDGTRGGVVTKFSRKGLFCKTWEGEMNLGGLRRETEYSSDGQSTVENMVPNTFEFTVEDDKAHLVPVIQKSLEEGRHVTLHYKQDRLISPCRSSSGGYFVDGIMIDGMPTK